MPKLDCKEWFLNEMCLTFCNQVNFCPEEAECYYRMQVREIIENICDDDSDNGVDEA